MLPLFHSKKNIELSFMMFKATHSHTHFNSIFIMSSLHENNRLIIFIHSHILVLLHVEIQGCFQNGNNYSICYIETEINTFTDSGMSLIL